MNADHQASARMAPYDSDDYLFGTERAVLEKHMRQKLEDAKRVVVAQGGQKPAASTSTPKQSFRKDNTSSSKKQPAGNKKSNQGPLSTFDLAHSLTRAGK